MIDINNMSDKTAIKEQYKNTDNLKLRKSLHEKYSVNKIGFHKWMFEQYPFRPGMKVLELGSGRGELWNYYFDNDKLQSYEMDITLSDFSDGMVEQMLEKQFRKVERYDYEDALEIDNVEDYLEYIYSMASLQGLDRKYYDILRNYFNSKKVNGYLHIPKEYGMFVAGKE